MYKWRMKGIVDATTDIFFQIPVWVYEKMCFIAKAATANIPTIKPVCPSFFIASL